MGKVEKIIKILGKRYVARSTKGNPFHVLIETMISQRTKDDVTEKAAARLLRAGDTPREMLKLTERQIGRLILPANYFRTKAKRIRQICRILIEKYGGNVPETKKELDDLPGVGAKTASIVLSYSFGAPTIAVDTHVNRISQRLGFVPSGSRPEKTQEALERIVPKRYRIGFNHIFVSFGQDICRPLHPFCGRCQIYRYCRYEKKQYYRNLLPS
jgi:endonuclease-3